MKYFKLGYINNIQTWLECDFDPHKRQINLYDKIGNQMIFKGIGLY